MKRAIMSVLWVMGVVAFHVRAEAQTTDSLLAQATVHDCVQYALVHQPALKQSQSDEDITDRTVKSKLADWYPQIGLTANFQHYFQLPKANFGGNIIQQGVANTSTVGAGLTQNIFNRDVLLASSTARTVRLQARQSTVNNQINTIANVSKAYYDVLLTQRQIEVLVEDTIRLQRSLRDAYNQYQGGITDKVDYKQAQISLNNAKSQLKSATELLHAKYAVLKQQMGYPVSGTLNLVYDSATMVQQAVALDTSTQVVYENRIEYQLEQTTQQLLQAELRYERWSFLPTVSAFANYNLAYFNEQFSKTYNADYPNSYAGLQLSLPIFQGTKRTQNIRIAELQLSRSNWDIAQLKEQINTEYTQAMATYKGNLNDFFTLKENVDLANDVYATVNLQYREGVKTYLDVIVAESDLRTAQLNYFNALYSVLSAKVDLQRSLGTLTPQTF
ncbi:MAG TPA: TolC family protein [Chitinophaga sp.]